MPHKKIKSLLQGLKEHPRIELIPALLNLPFLLGLLVLVSLDPEYRSEINFEGSIIFGRRLDYVAILRIFSICVLAFIGLLILLNVLKRERIPVGMFVIPIFSLILFNVGFIFILRNNTSFTIHFLHQSLGHHISVILFLAISCVILGGFLSMCLVLPKLWNAQPKLKGKSRFYPKTLSVLTLIGFLTAIVSPLLLLIGHPSMTFWWIITFKFNTVRSLVIFHAIFILIFALSALASKYPGPLASKLNQEVEKIRKWCMIEMPLVLAIQLLLMVGIGIIQGFSRMLLYPFSLVSYTEFLYYLADNHFQAKFRTILTKISSNQNVRRALKTSVLLFPMMWILLFQPLVSLPPLPKNRVGIDVEELNIVHNSYSSLTATQKTLFDDFLDHELPAGSDAEVVYSSNKGTRTSIRVASALLFRNHAGDVENASFIIQRVLNAQHTNKSKDNYGSFQTSFESDRRDENWREFIGCELIIILEKHADKLSENFTSGIKNALVMAAEGAYRRNQGPGYTNIALMSAFLMEYVGVKMNIPKVRDTGTRISWELFVMFSKNHTFTEFNSPTYYGVDMLALAMWRDLGPTVQMRRMGAKMELDLWREISEFYHAGFKNIVGPYFRSYGMDMEAYTSIIGMWVALALNDLNQAPLPHVSTYTNFELSNVLPAVQLGHSIPNESILHNFRSFSGPRFLKRRVPSDFTSLRKEYRITAMLQSEWMMGGVSGKVKGSGQIKAGTLHWNSSVDNSLSWLLVSGLDYLDVEISRNCMEIRQTGYADNITFYVNCKGLNAEMINGSEWILPGIKLEIEGDSSKISAEPMVINEFGDAHYTRHGLTTIVKVTGLLDTMKIYPSA